MIAPAWVTRNLGDPFGPALKCNFHTRLVVGGDRTPSGATYDFQPGEERDDVMKEDIDYLLSIKYQQTACCGNQPGAAIHYFVLA